ncbi:unnamed protein product [Hydatigera taeniaeformis]|uniref:ATP-dependent (S)-NAD(P)H-hydrate dehydratase n=1 Tax=Hydatigena taeniaeformis TaxID=6205 RepID=A0A3P7G3B6_HYDTA|nr:unnamed protein product [Hydatigera taeniaeformis]
MSNALHKGQMGRIAVVGGSKEYTGAPYFAAITALSCGADLVHVICAASAAQAIKCYSPELIVHPTLDIDLTESLKWVSKMHSAVIGPGLGVRPSEDPKETSKLAAALGNLTIIRKGPKDIITDGENSTHFYIVKRGRAITSTVLSYVSTLLKLVFCRWSPIFCFKVLLCDTQGSPRRCGGQGDLLSGAAAVFSHWFAEKPPICSSLFKRSFLTTRMIDEVAPAFDELFRQAKRLPQTIHFSKLFALMFSQIAHW